MERSGAEKGTGTTELLLYNSLLSLPFIALVSRAWAGGVVNYGNKLLPSLQPAPIIPQHMCTHTTSAAPRLLPMQMMLATGEAGQAWPAFVAGADQLGVSAMAALVACCSVAGLLLNFSLFWCCHLNSALTTTIVGVMKVRWGASGVHDTGEMQSRGCVHTITLSPPPPPPHPS